LLRTELELAPTKQSRKAYEISCWNRIRSGAAMKVGVDGTYF
jgi:hypothetical protein